MSCRLARALCSLLLATLAACQSGIDAGDEALAPGEPIARARRCPDCGWIESKREILPAVVERHAVRSFEYTVRMTDGSSRVFREALPTSWRLKERLTVIGGAPLD